MENPDPVSAVDHEKADADAEAEVDAEAALLRRARERATMSAREFVSERDALEDAWAGTGEHGRRDEGW